MIPPQSDDHWILLILGLAAMFTQLALSFVCAAIFVFGLNDIPDTVSASITALIITFAIALGLSIIQIFIHEMGHALAAWSVKRRVHIICVGRLAYAPEVGKFAWIDKPHNAEYAGFVQASPIWPDLDRRKSIWISAGGPLLTALTGLIIYIMAPKEGALSLPFLIMAGYFFMDAVVNLMPLRWSGGSASDGLHILQYLGGRTWSLDEWAASRLETAPYSRGVVTEAEWAALKPMVGRPFNSEVVNRLLAAAAKERL